MSPSNVLNNSTSPSHRPMAVTLMARASNVYMHGTDMVTEPQERMAMIAEMIHTARWVDQ